MEEWCDGDVNCLMSGTRWSSVWKTNSIVMLLHALNFTLLAFGGFWFYPRMLGTFFNWILLVCHFAAIGFALYSRYNPFGVWCSYNEASNDAWAIDNYKDFGKPYASITQEHGRWITSYRADADLMVALAVMQSTLCVISTLFFTCPLYRTPVKDEDSQFK